MTRNAKRLSKPVYELLPWAYMAGGAAALFGSYLSPYRALSLAVGLMGFAGVLGGIVVLLRRRDYRQMKSQYGNPDALRDLGKD